MIIKLESLNEQLKNAETQFEQLKTDAHIAQGAVLMLKHLIIQAEAPDPPPTDPEVK